MYMSRVGAPFWQPHNKMCSGCNCYCLFMCLPIKIDWKLQIPFKGISHNHNLQSPTAKTRQLYFIWWKDYLVFSSLICHSFREKELYRYCKHYFGMFKFKFGESKSGVGVQIARPPPKEINDEKMMAKKTSCEYVINKYSCTTAVHSDNEPTSNNNKNTKHPKWRLNDKHFS